MGLRRAIGCLLFLLLLTGAVGGTYVWSLWTRMDEMLHGRLVDGFKEAVPNWNVQFVRARFDFQGLIRIDDFRLSTPDSEIPILAVPESVVSVDREQLGHQRFVCQQVRLVQPELDLHRDLEGHWNWESLLPIPLTDASPPEWIIERGKLRLTIERPEPQRPLAVMLQNVQLRLTPSGKRRYVISGSVFSEAIGEIGLNGHWNIDEKTWKLDGRIDQFKFDSEVWDQLCQIFPQFQTKLTALPEQLGLPLTGEPVTDPGLTALGDLTFDIEKSLEKVELDYHCTINLNSGQWIHPLSPYPLDDIQGQIYCDPTQVSIPKFNARHGTLQVIVQKGLWNLSRADKPITAVVGLRNLPLEPGTRARLSEHLQEVYDHVQPTGKVDLNMQLAYTQKTGFRCDCDVIPKGCSAAHVKFPYPVDDIQGLITKRGNMIKLKLTGMAAGQREVKLTGEVRQGTVQPSTWINVRVDSVPLDEVFLASAPKPTQAVLKALNLQGLANINYQLSRNGGHDAPWETQLWSSLRNGTMACKCFPYAINDLRAIIEYDGEQWTFKKVKGVHGAAEMTASGQYRIRGEDGRLSLSVKTVGAEFNGELEAALPESWKKLFEEFTPKGRFDSQAMIEWSPGGTPEITLDANVRDVEMQLKSFPFPLNDVKGFISIHRDEQDPTAMRAELSGFEGRHEDTKLAMNSGFALMESAGSWTVRLDELQIEDLSPNNRFRRALPPSFREVVDTLDPRDGPVSLAGMLEFRGSGHPAEGATSAWDLEVLCTDTSVTTGVDLKHLYGKFKIRGTWDGRSIETEGLADLTSLSIQGYQFSGVKGPISIYGNQLVIGCRDVVNPRQGQRGSQKKPLPDERITARAIGGVFTLDGIAVLGKETSYTVVLTMRDALLERYAELYMPQQHDLRGIMTGEARLNGRGNKSRSLKGNGQLLIRPAALYQLPVMLAVLKQLNGGSADNTAFEEAQAFFDISNGRFNFRQVDLKGAALNLKGFGVVSFDRRLTFDFFSSVPRNRAPLAILQQMVGHATVGWMGITVRGTLDNPDAKIRPVQALDGALKRVLNGIDPRSETGQRGPPSQTNPRGPRRMNEAGGVTRRP